MTNNTTLTRVNREQLRQLKIEAAKRGTTILVLLTKAIDKFIKPKNAARS